MTPEQPRRDWTWGNDTPVWLTPRRTIYFIYCRAEGGGIEYLRNKQGRLRTWRSQEAVKAALESLNAEATLQEQTCPPN
jgi:hypothetical protein